MNSGSKKRLKDHQVPESISSIHNAETSIASESSPRIDIVKKGRREWEKTVDAIDDIITILNPELKIIRANLSAHREFGYEFGELIGKHCYSAFHSSDVPCDNCPVIETIRTSKKQRSMMYLEYSGKTLDISASPVFDNNGRISMVVHIARDVTTRLKQKEEYKRLLKAIEQASDVIVVTDRNGNIQYTNPAFTRVTGYSNEEAVGRNMNILGSGEHNPAFYRKLWQSLLRGNAWKGTFVNRKKDGTLYSEESTISPVLDSDGKIDSFVAVKRDTSKEESLEKQLQQAIKLEAIGTLAGGIAHDFNNILSAILGYAQIAKSQTDRESPVHNALDQIISSGDRAAELIRQILTFSRQDNKTGPLKPLRIQYILKEALKMIRSSLPATIKLNQDIDASTPTIMADASQIHQVVMNLCTNAKQAIKEEYGQISVSLAPTECRRHVCLKISDTGCGMTDHTLKRIFDPFFTTKPKDHGTGLGLSVVHGIVKKHKGTIEVESKEGTGSSFTLTFPAVEMEEEKTAADSAPAKGGDEHILIVDDELPIMNYQKQILERLGYKATCFSESIEAVRHFRKHSDRFDLVITDMTMPDMTGAELAREILSIKESLPIILTTGYSESINKEKAEQIGIRAFLTKPVRKEELARIIREALENG